jgi:hypothetical protein
MFPVRFNRFEYMVKNKGFDRLVGIDRFTISAKDAKQFDALFHIARKIAVKKIADELSIHQRIITCQILRS